ncbi:MAG: hypothetical protein QM528_08750 [Phycisphaerales bacterium]|nr:hypothetical protein [Phycisphaerales bacterium]
MIINFSKLKETQEASDVNGDAPGVAIPIPSKPFIRVPLATPSMRSVGNNVQGIAFDFFADYIMTKDEEARNAKILSAIVVGGILEGKIGDIGEKVDQLAQKTKTLVTNALDKVANVILNAHGAKNQSTGSFTKGGTKATKHQKGATHGSLSSKKGNKANPNKRKGAENRGGKKNN